MRSRQPCFFAVTIRRAAILVGVALLPAPALAQYIGGDAPPLPAPPRPGEVQTPAGALTRALRTLAQSPRDFGALITAGRAALDLGDTQAAIGFFGRAEEIRPSDPAPKIGMGAATVITGDASGALRWFFEAQRLGATSAALGADRGLAQDLLGNQPSAQVDYRAALGGREADEARRRLALSLGISGNRVGAFTVLQPLLARRDPAAQRIRAFVLALVGDERGASSAIDQAMPGTGARMAGFFRLLPTLSAPQKAAAVHLGIFPDPSQIRVAAVSPRLVAVPPAMRVQRTVLPAVRVAPVAELAPGPGFTPAPRTNVVERDPRPLTRGLDFQTSESRPLSARPIADRTILPAPRSAPGTPTAAAPVNVAPQSDFATAQADTASVPLDVPDEAPEIATLSATAPPVERATAADMVPATSEPAIVPLSEDRLSGIDRLLAQADELPVPPAPRPRAGKRVWPATITVKPKWATADKKVADLDSSADERDVKGSVGISGINWVQLAGGARVDGMSAEFRRLAAKSAALKKRGGAVTAGKDYFRLLTGPFPNRADAQAFVNQLAKDGVDGFSWTRTPASLRIEKIAPK